MRTDVVTIFPEMFEGPMSASIVGIARDKGALDLHVHDLRDYTDDPHRTTDDYPYGGGPGMVMKPEPIFRAVRALRAADPEPPFTVFLTPAGVPFDQTLAEELATKPRLLLVCGRYEGFDERVYALADLRVSIGDYVLSGGELAAMVVIDTVARLLPGVLGDSSSAADESFTGGLLEYPQYTRPAEFEGMAVPDVLRSGDHARIAEWRRREALRVTARFRPDLLERAAITPEERQAATEMTGDDDACA